MTVSKKQLKANRENAKKGGVKTPKGKEIVKYNALKHGLLAKEVVVDAGEGIESQQEFDTLISDLKDQYKPVGSVEEMMVEKVAVAYWRLRRARRYETGLIRNELDTVTDDYYNEKDYVGEKFHETDEEIDREIQASEEEIKIWKNSEKNLSRMYKAGKSLEEIYEWEDNWRQLYDKFREIFPEDTMDDDEKWIEQLREFLNDEAGWSDDHIWQIHIALCDERVTALDQDIVKMKKEKIKNMLALQVIKKLGSIPSKDDLDRLLRYETTIDRQLYKALNQLERMQRLRAGDNIPAPLKVDIDLNPGDSQ